MGLLSNSDHERRLQAIEAGFDPLEKLFNNALLAFEGQNQKMEALKKMCVDLQESNLKWHDYAIENEQRHVEISQAVAELAKLCQDLLAKKL